MDTASTSEICSDDKLRQSLAELVGLLGLDRIMNEENKPEDSTVLFGTTWAYYIQISPLYAIQDHQKVHWLSSLLYIAYEEQIFKLSQQRDKAGEFVHFDLALMLRHVQLSVSGFLSICTRLTGGWNRHSVDKKKMKRDEMLLNVPDQLLARLHKLESEYNVSSILFLKYKRLFDELFLVESGLVINRETGKTLNGKVKHQQINADLFNIGWLLYVSVKKFYPSLGSDLVNSYHLLLCSMSAIHTTLVTLKHQSSSKADPLIVQLKQGQILKSERRRILEYLSELESTDPIQLKTVYEYHFKSKLTHLHGRLDADLLFKTWPDMKRLFTTLTKFYEKNDVNEARMDTFLANYIYFTLSFDETCFLGETNDFNTKRPTTLELHLPECLLVSQDGLKLYETKTEHELKDSLIKAINREHNPGLTEIVEEMFRLLNRFFSHSVNKLLDEESFKLAESKTSSELVDVQIKKIAENETFINSIYVCAFETFLNASVVRKLSSSDSNERSSSLLDLLDCGDQFIFPWCLNQIGLDALDLLRSTELFVNCNSLTREMIQHLNWCEERIIEELAWSSSSSMWQLLGKLTTNPNYLNQDQLRFNFAVPVYDDLFKINSTSLPGQQQTMSKQPTITRVVCSTNTQTTSTIQVVNLNGTTTTTQLSLKRKAPNENKNCVIILTSHQRLLNLDSFVAYFFRKFYMLAMRRIRSLLDRLDVATLISRVNRISDKKQLNTNVNATPAPTTSILTPIAPSSSIQSPHITPTASHTNLSNTTLILNQNQLHQPVLFSSSSGEEELNLCRKIWYLFEYSIGLDKAQSLIKCRQIDQIIMCCVYMVCRMSSLPVHFNEIIKRYGGVNKRLIENSEIYRNVVISDNEYGDLVKFYNEIYVPRVKEEAIRLASDVKSTTSPKANCISEWNKFVSKKVSLDQSQSVFVTPSRSDEGSSGVSNRQKLTFSLNDQSIVKSVENINEMLKKNENIKVLGKRLFEEISGSSNSLSSSPGTMLTPSQFTNVNTSAISNILNQKIFDAMNQALKENDKTSNGLTRVKMTRALTNYGLTSVKKTSITLSSSEETDSGVNSNKIARISSFNSYQRPLITTPMNSQSVGSTSNNLLFKVLNNSDDTNTAVSSTNTTTLSSSFKKISSVKNTATIKLILGDSFAKRLLTIQNERTPSN